MFYPWLVKYWEIIADNLKRAGWSWGCVAAIDSNGRPIWIADAHRDDFRSGEIRVLDSAGYVISFSEMDREL